MLLTVIRKTGAGNPEQECVADLEGPGRRCLQVGHVTCSSYDGTHTAQASTAHSLKNFTQGNPIKLRDGSNLLTEYSSSLCRNESKIQGPRSNCGQAKIKYNLIFYSGIPVSL